MPNIEERTLPSPVVSIRGPVADVRRHCDSIPNTEPREQPLSLRSLGLSILFHAAALGTVGVALASEHPRAAGGNTDRSIVFARAESREPGEANPTLPFDVIEPEISQSDPTLVPIEDSFEELSSIDPDFDLEEFEAAPVRESEWPSQLPDLRFAKRQDRPIPPGELLPMEPPAAHSVSADSTQSESSRGDLEPLLLKAPSPRYPSLARRKLWEGSVLCRIRVAIDGTVIAVSVAESSGYTVLDEAALEAIRNWRFRPGEREGIPAELVIVHRITFQLTP